MDPNDLIDEKKALQAVLKDEEVADILVDLLIARWLNPQKYWIKDGAIYWAEDARIFVDADYIWDKIDKPNVSLKGDGDFVELTIAGAIWTAKGTSLLNCLKRCLLKAKYG